jgi:hypothetical protein
LEMPNKANAEIDVMFEMHRYRNYEQFSFINNKS